MRIDPIDLENDGPFLWDALGGTVKEDTLSDCNGMGYPSHDFMEMLLSIEEPIGCCSNVFRLLPSQNNRSSSDDKKTKEEQAVGMASYITTPIRSMAQQRLDMWLTGVPRHERSPPQRRSIFFAKHAFEIITQSCCCSCNRGRSSIRRILSIVMEMQF